MTKTRNRPETRCANCHHGRTAEPGCQCGSAWCPCHKAHTGHGGWACDCPQPGQEN